MKIIFLNTWNAKEREAITAFILEHRESTEVFCFQEAYEEMRLLAKEILPDYEETYGYKWVSETDDFPQATYVRKDLEQIVSHPFLEEWSNTGLAIYTHLRKNGQEIHLANFHGTARPGEKLDNPGRLKQSEELIRFFKDKEGLKIIGGDFNVLPDTESMQMFEKHGYRDLIKDFGIKSTRNELSWARYPDNKQYFSDYAFMSPNVNVQSFEVPDIEISDHLPLILEIG